MKKIFTLILTLFLIGSFSSFAFAKNYKVSKIKNNTNSIQKGIQAISPKNTTQISPQLTAQIESIKKSIDSNNAITKQINTKKTTINKLINQIRKSKQSLTNDQYTSANAFLTAINAEMKKIVTIKGINVLTAYDKSKNAKVLNKISTTDLTNIQNSLNQNATSLNIISANYDSVIAILTVVANTTPSAITLPITTQSGISN